jgi:HK97 family phage major capsid protein
MSVTAAKRKEYKTRTDEAVALQEKIASALEADAKADVKADQEAFDKLMDETIPGLETEIKRLERLDAAKTATEGDDEGDEPAPQRKTRDNPGRVTERALEAATIGDALINSETFKKAVEKAKNGDKFNLGLDLKNIQIDRRLVEAKADTTFSTTAAGLDTATIYLPRPVELLSQQRLKIRDILPVGTTNQSTVKWIKEDTFVNDADMVAEEGQKPYSELDLGPASADVKKIAILQKITDETLEDFPFLRSYINTRTTFKLMAKEEQQLLNGTGAGSQIRGILNFTGIQSQAKAADTNLDAIHKAITKVREVMTAGTGGYEPDAIVMHPTDYELIRLAKDNALQYFGGGPFQYGPYGGGTYQSLANPWGLRVVVTTAITAGTALVGDFANGAMIAQRSGVRIELFNQNVDDVEFNRLTLRVEERLALLDFADTAFCKVTGIS